MRLAFRIFFIVAMLLAFFMYGRFIAEANGWS